MQEMDRVLIAQAALSHWCSGDYKTFLQSSVLDEGDNTTPYLFTSTEQADKWFEEHKEVIEWTTDHIEDILRDAVYQHVAFTDWQEPEDK